MPCPSYHQRLESLKGHSWRDNVVEPRPAPELRTTLPTLPCWRCGARAGCEHRSED